MPRFPSAFSNLLMSLLFFTIDQFRVVKMIWGTLWFCSYLFILWQHAVAPGGRCFRSDCKFDFQ